MVPSQWQALPSDAHRIVAQAPDQESVDQLIDRLRTSGVSIVGLSRRRLSLEQAYLEIVAEAVE